MKNKKEKNKEKGKKYKKKDKEKMLDFDIKHFKKNTFFTFQRRDSAAPGPSGTTPQAGPRREAEHWKHTGL